MIEEKNFNKTEEQNVPSEMVSAKTEFMGNELDKKENTNSSTEKEEAIVSPPTMFSRAFLFSGRIRRLEFGLSLIIYWVIAICINVMIEDLLLRGLLYIPLLWFWFAQLCKRFHDRNESGWNIFALIIPFYNLLLLVMLLFEDGDEYENDYGVDPKGRNIW